ncbi:S-layer homology domain-containing protein [Intestinimonas sp. MSJ-38]|uniref:S-layer homology domain-containing protein n=1 Tax=Intestinimonas sp. MSJ-38 TaxID=2841532 RepID=UPI001C127A75|nr:S-layer homology domain-containing protein [Intestinimonas sp. MSJ-38]MBU5431411.1 S-layer homology domain-containing protein [Intestinimonas sp. MSJ-38]
MWIEMGDDDPGKTGFITIRKDISSAESTRNIEIGTYIFSVFAPDANGGEIQQNFTLIVTEENSSKTETSTAITSIAPAAFGDTLTLTATVTADTPVDNSAVEYYINGKKINSNPVSVTPDNGFKLDDNELRAIYPGNDTYAVSVGTANVTVSKATDASIHGFQVPTGGTFNGTAHTGSQTNLAIQRNGITLDSSPSVTVEYTQNNQPVSQPVFPGNYTVTLSAPEGETYEAISRQSAGNFTIGKAAPTVTASAEDKGNGTVELTATVSGVGAYFPTGSVTFKLGTHEVSAVLNNGTASQTIKNVAAGTHQYSASYTPAGNDALYNGASSGEQSIDVNGSQPQPPVKPEITLTDISITKQPDKMEYVEGDKFDPTGMVVTATYSDGTTAPVTEFTFEPKRALTTNDTSITVSYAKNNETRTTTQAITVTPKDPTVTPGAVVTISGAPATAVYGDSFTLTASAANADTNGTWTWTSSNPAVLEITGSGSSVTVKVLKASTAPVTITATYTSGEKNVSATTSDIRVTHRAITVRADNKSMTVGGTLPALTVSCGNFASGDTADMVFATQAAASTTADGKTAGSFPITVTAPTLKDGWADKYELGTIESGTLTVRAQSSSGSSSGGGGSSSGGSSSSGKVETTTKPDGTTVKTETKKDGTKVETTTAKDGSTSKTTTNPNGSSVTENKAADGSTGTVKTDRYGQTTAETQLSGKAIEDAKKNGEPVKAPVEVEATRNSNTAPVVNIEVPKSAGETKVEIPVSNVKPGTVAVLVHPDGTEEIIKNSVPTEDGIQLTVNGGATVKIVDNSKDFIDTREHWSRDQVNFVAARELFQGVGNNQFGVEHPMTRGMVNTVLARLAGVDTTSAAGQNWYDKGVAWARENGVSDGSNPDGNVTREQLATMLYRYAGSPAVNGSLPFSDADTASDYAQDALLWATQNGILNGYGDGRIGPKANAERAQVAAMMARFIQNAQ